ncbi:phage tail protein [Oceanobacillus sp. J11TS1]|uniref:phage tail protein n=1 Tax=Oceanobacillus sp. J11TS1 TaxID=2807191 RepID=UPI001B147F14|nr:phage tail protein [Oceanobacillus sp. J11TS1]GIO25157.1 hypothetical protein J11TS1_37380 [Oceanobacillus sp. J11TS1]
MIEIPYEFSGTVKYQNYQTVVERIEKFDRFFSIGKDQSGTYDMYLIELGNASKPCLFITGSMHGTEWHGTQYSMKFMEDLRDNTFPDTDFRNFVLNNFCIAYIPMINPYGMDHVVDEYAQYDYSARYNSNHVELNDDFYHLTQAESKNVAAQIDKYKPFAYLDMHMFQPEYSVGYGNKFILANGQRETNNVRDLWRDSFEAYAGEKMTIWTNPLAPDSGLARGYAARQSNLYTPHTLSYITEFVRPAYINGEFVEPLSKTEIFKYGTASLYLFFKTSIKYFMENVTAEEYKSQTMFVRDLNGREYHLQATTTHEFELNGHQSLTFEVLPTKVNSKFINDISEMWEVIDDDNVVHKIVRCQKQGVGPHSPDKKRLKVKIKAIPLFFDTLNSCKRIEKEYNEHMTAQLAFSRVFEGLPFEFVIVGKFDAVQWEGFGGGESRLETFKRALERYKMEFRIVGNIVYLERRVGRDTSIQYRHKLNASNIAMEIDGTGFWTYAIGYGDYGNEGEGEGETSDWQNAKLVREYTSPLAKIPGIGIRQAPSIKDGRITSKTTMDKGLKELVEESLKVSVSADIHDLRNQGYPIGQSQVGDRVFLIDERIGLDDEVRIVSQSITKDWKGDVIAENITFGSEGIAKRHQSNINAATKQINELIEGRRKLPFSVLDEAVKNATKALQNAQTELIFGGNGIVAKDKKNPNYLTLFNSAGVGVSDDGGNTFRQAITGQGINASTIVTGTMVADFIAGGILSSLNGRTSFNLNNGELDMTSARFRLGSGASIDFTSTSNRLTYELGGRTAGVGLTTSINEAYPVVFMGTTGTRRDNFGATDDRWFRGFIANTNARMNEDDSSNSVVGRRFRVVNIPVSWNKGFEFDLSGTVNVFKPIVNTDMTYDIGVPEQPFRNLYAENLRRVSRIETPNVIQFRNQYENSNVGWTLELTYGDKGTVDFYPINTGTPNYYNIGRADNRINTAYLNVIESNLIGREYRDVNQIWVNTVSYNNLNIRSMRKYKENIEDLELKDALEFVTKNDVKIFDYKRSNEDGQRTLFDKKVGIILDDLIADKDYLFKGSEETLDSGNITFIHQKVLQYLLMKIEELDNKNQPGYQYRTYKQRKSYRRKDVINEEQIDESTGTI